MSAVTSGEQFARRVVESKKGKPPGSTRGLRAATSGKVAAAKTAGQARRAHVEARNNDAASRKPARGKVSAGEVAKAQRAAAATRTTTPAMVQKQTAHQHAVAAASRRDASAGARTRNAARAGDTAMMERVVREAAADGDNGPPRPALGAAAPVQAAAKARRKSLGAASPKRLRRAPRAASERAAMAARTRSAAAKRSDAPAQTRASTRARQTTAAAVSAAAHGGSAVRQTTGPKAKAAAPAPTFTEAAQQPGKSVQRGLRAASAEAITGEKLRFAARVGSEAVVSGVQGLRSSSGFASRALSSREAGSTAKAVSKAIRDAPQVAIDVATAGLRPK